MMHRRRAAWLVVGTCNTHKGFALTAGVLGWLFGACPRVMVWALQEVPSLPALRRALHATGEADRWMILPGFQIAGRGVPYFLVRRIRFKVMSTLAPDISFGSRHDRRRTTAVLADQVTGRQVDVLDVHPDPLGRGFVLANRAARGRHERQVQAHADRAAQGPPEAVVIALGDWNEHLGELVQRLGARIGALRPRSARARRILARVPLAGRTATARMRRAGLVPSHSAAAPRPQRVNRTVRLDDAFYRPDPHIQLRYRRVLTPPTRYRLDHPVVVCGYWVAPLGQTLPAPIDPRTADTGTGSA